MQRQPIAHPPINRRTAAAWWLAAGLTLAGCASSPPAAMPPAPWSGRLALQVNDEPPQSFAALFELRGSATDGELLLQTPLGTSLARVAWTPAGATIQTSQGERRADSLPQLLTKLTGTDLPVQHLFEWLEGRPSDAAGWEADLSQHALGRIRATRHTPAPTATLRIALTR